jgi:maltose alpha-D-glucosyltransferase / alpha-amylase
LSRLDEPEKEEYFRAFAPKKEMQLYGRGIRRRLAPMFNGDPTKILLAYSLIFTIPGTPVFWYGEEIGMGEDLSLEERNSVRTPMQWSGERNGGFSMAPKECFRFGPLHRRQPGYERLRFDAPVRGRAYCPASLPKCRLRSGVRLHALAG